MLAGTLEHSPKVLAFQWYPLSPYLLYFLKALLTTCYELSCFGRVQLFETLWTVARQAPLSVGLFRQED